MTDQSCLTMPLWLVRLWLPFLSKSVQNLTTCSIRLIKRCKGSWPIGNLSTHCLLSDHLSWLRDLTSPCLLDRRNMKHIFYFCVSHFDCDTFSQFGIFCRWQLQQTWFRKSCTYYNPKRWCVQDLM
jgi:hypothetical protein